MIINSTSNKTIENKADDASQKDLVEVYDGREGIVEKAQKEGTDAEKQLVESEFKGSETAIRKVFKDYCNENDPQEVFIDGIAEGSFTKPSSAQKAFLGSEHKVMLFEK